MKINRGNLFKNQSMDIDINNAHTKTISIE
jgi:hypothetical protein